jgi:6-hydroxynicotinate 3-monooxygenase
LRVLVIGAGIGGLAAALALRSRGFEARIFEQAQTLERVGAGIGFGPNALHVLEPLEVADAVRDAGFCPAASIVYDGHDGSVLSELPNRQEPAMICLHRADAHRVLAEALTPGTLTLKRRLVDLEQDDQGVTAVFEDGSCERGDVLIGADGLHSRVRELLFGSERPRYTGRATFRALVPAERVSQLGLDSIVGSWRGRDNRQVLHYRLKHEMNLRAEYDEPEWTAESWSLRGDVSELRALVADFHPTVVELFSHVEDVHKWGLWDREPFPRWSVGRVTLLGDAAHAMTPNIGQGASTGVEDAAILTRCLEATDGDISRALLRYETARHERTSILQGQAVANLVHTTASFDWVWSYRAWSEPIPEQVPLEAR